jgi:hypothetical protein
MVAGFEEGGRQVAPSVGGFPIKVRLANTQQQTKKEVTVGRLLVGTKDHVYLRKSLLKRLQRSKLKASVRGCLKVER